MKRQVLIDDGLPYRGGLLQHECACGWSDGQSRVELGACLQCGGPLGPPHQLLFGGLLVEWRDRGLKNDFVLVNKCPLADGIQICEADVHDTITFMARRFRPCHDRSLPSLNTIRTLVQQALVAAQNDHPDLCQQALQQLLDELKPIQGIKTNK